MTRAIEVDYIVVGAGAMGMAFTDALTDHADVRVALVDRRHGTSGHWLEAYPFVRLHQSSAFYGVPSTLLGGGQLQQQGPEAGLQERATQPEICFDETFARVSGAARNDPSVEVRRTVPDLCAAMRCAELSVSQCGYNTALDIVRAGVPALVVPFDDNGDSEQTDRAERLERLNAVRLFRGSLDAGALADAIRDAMAFSPTRAKFDMDGAERTAAVLRAALDGRMLALETYERLA